MEVNILFALVPLVSIRNLTSKSTSPATLLASLVTITAWLLLLLLSLSIALVYAVDSPAVAILSYLNGVNSPISWGSMMSILPLLGTSIRGLASASNSFNSSAFRANIKIYALNMA
jgi:hypothetical protein